MDPGSYNFASYSRSCPVANAESIISERCYVRTLLHRLRHRLDHPAHCLHQLHESLDGPGRTTRPRGGCPKNPGRYAKGAHDLAGFIIRQGSNADRDLEELWRRIVFYIAVKNTDDHLRNHGFVLQDGGWALSPAFDINPVPHGNGLTLNISETDNSLNYAVARSVAKYFRVNLVK